MKKGRWMRIGKEQQKREVAESFASEIRNRHFGAKVRVRRLKSGQFVVEHR